LNPENSTPPESKTHAAALTNESAASVSSSRSSSPDEDESDVADILLAAVTSETGFGTGNMKPSTLFSDIGSDSLTSIAIISTTKRQIGVELPASIFIDNPTISDVGRELGISAQTIGAPAQSFTASSQSVPDVLSLSSGGSSPYPEDTPAEEELQIITNETLRAPPIDAPPAPDPQPQKKKYTSNVVLIQGRACSKETPLFLAPTELAPEPRIFTFHPCPRKPDLRRRVTVLKYSTGM